MANFTHGPTVERPCSHNERHPHGSRARYNHDRCRCAPCREAQNVFQRGYRLDRARRAWSGDTLLVDARGTARRLQALAVEGWGSTSIAARIGLRREEVEALRGARRRSGKVKAATAAKVTRVFEELGAEPAPVGYGATRARAAAARRGWVSALAWDDIDHDDAPVDVAEPERVRDVEVDEVVVDELVTGRRASADASRRERLAAVEYLTRHGYGAAVIADRLATNRRTVVRDRADLGLTAPANEHDDDVQEDTAA